MPAFDAATIKPNRSVQEVSSIRLAQGRVSMENVSLQKVVLNAYGIPDDRQYMVEGPGWLSTARFNIEATFAPESAPEQVRQMLQNMLVERFRMASHREVKRLSMYSLTAARDGAKIHAVEDGPGRTSGGPGRIEATKTTMTKLADLLGRIVGVPVVDNTDLKGAFDFTLEWAPDEAGTNANGAASIFTALHDQLGLKLVGGKGPAEVLVVDRIERLPTRN